MRFNRILNRKTGETREIPIGVCYPALAADEMLVWVHEQTVVKQPHLIVDPASPDQLTPEGRMALGGFAHIPGSAVFADERMAAAECPESAMGKPLPFPVVET